MDPTLEENQSNQSQQKRPAGESAINTINNLASARRLFKNPVGKVGSKVALQAGRSLITLLATNPWAWAVLGIIVVVIFTFIIVMGFGGTVPPSEINSQITPTPITLPAGSVTPAPAEP